MSTKTRLQHKRPIPIRLFNALNGFGAVSKLDADRLIRKAKKQTGLHDFGSPGLEEPLHRLIESINQEAQLHAFGTMITENRLLGILKTRLKAQQLFDQHPDILDRELPPLVVIAALQRTGTTMLQRLLSADPQARGLFSWEAMNPVPIKHAAHHPDPRIKLTLKSEKGLRYIAPQFFAIHPVEHDAQEEDVLLVDNSLISSVATATMHVPSFEEWVSTTDQAPAYEWHNKFLKLLDWQRTGHHWVLKTPHHLEFLDALHQQYPTVKLIMTHRHPKEIMASFSSMLWHGRQIFSNRGSAQEVTDTWVQKCVKMTENSTAFRDAHPEVAILDISYYDLIKDPMQEIERIYAFLGYELTPSAKAAMEKTRSSNKKHKYGKHQYQLSDFNLTEVEINQKFAQYLDRYQNYLKP
ncbi:MAG: sulfotransferase [Bacteroidota bacterium]